MTYCAHDIVSDDTTDSNTYCTPLNQSIHAVMGRAFCVKLLLKHDIVF